MKIIFNMRRRLEFLGLVGCLVAAPAGRARADEDLVVTGSRRAESSQKAVVHTDSVSRREAERRGATHVGEALAGQLGVQVNPAAYGYLGGPSAIQILGFDRDRVLVLEDNERVIGDTGGAIDLSALPLTDVARIEVVAGPTSALYGAGALGGVVNVLTAPPAPGATGRLRLEARSYRWLVGQGSAALRTEGGFVVLDASLSRRDGVARFDDGRPDLLVPRSARSLVGLRAGTTVGRASLTLRARWIRDALDGLESQEFPGLGRYLTDLPQRSDRFALHLVDTLALGGEATLRLSLARQWVLAEAWKDRRDSPLDERRRRTQGLSAAEATLVAPAPSLDVVLGLRVEVETYAQRLEKTFALDAQGAIGTTDAPEVPALTSGNGAVYAQVTGRPIDGLTLLLGARGELHRRYGAVAAPRAAAAFQRGRFMVRLGIGRGFRSPSGKELGFTFDHSFYGYRVVGAPELRPETSWGGTAEIGVRGPDHLLLRCGAFANVVSDLIDVAPTGQTTAGVVDYRYRNVGQARTLGAQLDVTWPLRPFFRVELGYAYLSTRDETSGTPLPSRPAHTLRAATRWNLPRGLELVTRLRVVSDAWVDAATRSPSFSTLDARLEKRLAGSLVAHLGVLDALDVRAVPGRPGDQRPMDGRVIYVGLSAELPAEESP